MIVVGVRHNLVIDTDNVDEARSAAEAFSVLLVAGFDPVTATLCLVDNGTPAIKRIEYVGRTEGYWEAPGEQQPTSTGAPVSGECR